METIEISKAELKSELFEDVLFVQFAEGGAMGADAGTVCVVKPDGKLYRISLCKWDISLRDIKDAFPTMEKWNFGVCGNGGTASVGWRYLYIGLGNHLVIHESVYEEFCDMRENAQRKLPLWAWKYYAEQIVNKQD